jgi:hypothetical protein
MSLPGAIRHASSNRKPKKFHAKSHRQPHEFHPQSHRQPHEGIKLPSQGNELPSFAAPFRRRRQQRQKVAFTRQPVAQTRHGFALFTASTPITG